MSPISKVDDEVIQKRWEFRRMDNDDDSSSDQSKSSSEAAHKRHELVSGLVSLENEDGLGDCHQVQQTGKCNPHTDDQSMVHKGNRRHLRRSRKGKMTCNGIERGSSKVGKKKSKTSVYDPAALDELKVFTDTLLEDLKATRENVLSWMRKEMQKLVDDEPALRLELKEISSGRENVQVQPGDNFEENVQAHNKRKLEESILVLHENRFERDVLLQHENNSEENVFAQDHNTLKEAVQVKHLDKVKEIKCQVDHWNSFDSSTKAQKFDIGSPQRSTKSNISAGYNNSYHVKDTFQSCFADKNILEHNQTNYLDR